ncbi:DUF1569 domain-containing protein [Mangrovimonas sp. YM274]|uniref:DUF1569 domain-containing protein n=1 Tax=Mangrovimonas sp. YM274 TaxID=3070660 RepID=UPI0027DDB1B0|nr:DUF1569 domain-containing protein [Mangrovimonas sp. YM274]WMI68024.1 DUF1569 domain-containing protein [Mangrovimonas sp. YM274]
MKSLFDSSAHTEILERMENIQEHSIPLWGEMNAAKMFAHCCGPLKVSLGKLELEKPNFMMKFMLSFFRASLYDDKPWKKGLPTTKEYKITQDTNFGSSKKELIDLINEFHAKKDQTTWPVHPYFGSFTPEQWGMMQYKHLDHHFIQFGV